MAGYFHIKVNVRGDGKKWEVVIEDYLLPFKTIFADIPTQRSAMEVAKRYCGIKEREWGVIRKRIENDLRVLEEGEDEEEDAED